MMNIEPRKIKVIDLFQGYVDSGDDGVVAYNGILDIRPPYQREFVYDLKKSEEVIQTILNFQDTLV